MCREASAVLHIAIISTELFIRSEGWVLAGGG